MKKNLLLFVLSIHFFVGAQVPSMLIDLNPGAASSAPSGFYTLPNNDFMFYCSSSNSLNTGVYVTDGSTAGTKILKTFSMGHNLISYNFLPYNGKVYMNAITNSYNSVPLWRTDGTKAGTDSVPIAGLTGTNSIGSMTVFLNLIFITSGNKLWRSDGTTAGSYTIASGLSSFYYLESYNNLLYFTASNTVTGTELWRTDGTAAGTFMLKDIWPGPNSSSPNICGRGNNVLFFTADNQINGSELWKTDGTVNGTSMLKDIYPGAISSGINFQSAWSSNNGLYFNAKDFQNTSVTNYELWFSDGTSANTFSLISGNQTKPVFVGNNAYFLTTTNNSIFKTNGTLAGSSSISAVGSVPNPTVNSEISIIKSLMLYNNELYYLTLRKTAADSICFRKVDLNLSVRSMVLKIKRSNISTFIPSTYYQEMNNIVGNGHFIYFFNNNGFANPIDNVLIFNPNTNQARLFPIIASSKEFYTSSNYIVNNKLFFPFQSSFYGPGYLDLNTDSIVPLVNPTSGIVFSCSNAPINGFSYWHPFLYKLNNKNYFLCQNPNYGVEFYETDFTTANTQLVKDIYPGVNPFCTPAMDCDFPMIFPTPNNIYFLGNDGINGLELWDFINAPNNSVGVKESARSKQEIILFPNPANDVLHFKSNHSIHSIKIYNTMGDLLKSQFLNDNQQITEIEINQLAKGIYLVEIETQAGKETRKFVKE